MNKFHMKHTYTFYEDPGHAWLKVPLHDLERLDIDCCISNCSYISGMTQGGQYVYLEEDCDAQVFIDAAEANGWQLDPFPIVHQEVTPIRTYASYPASPDYRARLDDFYGRNQPPPTQGVRQP